MQNPLISEFAAQNTKSGLIGGYCEDGFPLYYANLEMAEMLGYNSIDEFAATIDGKAANTIHPDDMPRSKRIWAAAIVRA